jgi:hypothetical protein
MSIAELFEQIIHLPNEDQQHLFQMLHQHQKTAPPPMEKVLEDYDTPAAQTLLMGGRIPNLNAGPGYWMSEDFDDPLPDDFWNWDGQ